MVALFKDIEAGSSIGCAALVPSPPFKRKQRRWNCSEGFIPALDVAECGSQESFSKLGSNFASQPREIWVFCNCPKKSSLQIWRNIWR